MSGVNAAATLTLEVNTQTAGKTLDQIEQQVLGLTGDGKKINLAVNIDKTKSKANIKEDLESLSSGLRPLALQVSLNTVGAEKDVKKFLDVQRFIEVHARLDLTHATTQLAEFVRQARNIEIGVNLTGNAPRAPQAVVTTGSSSSPVNVPTITQSASDSVLAKQVENLKAQVAAQAAAMDAGGGVGSAGARSSAYSRQAVMLESAKMAGNLSLTHLIAQMSDGSKAIAGTRAQIAGLSADWTKLNQNRDVQSWKLSNDVFKQGQSALAGFNKEVVTLSADWTKLNQNRDVQSWKLQNDAFRQGQAALAKYNLELEATARAEQKLKGRRGQTLDTQEFKNSFDASKLDDVAQKYNAQGKNIYAAKVAVEQFGEAQTRAFLGSREYLVDNIRRLDQFTRSAKDAGASLAALEMRTKLASRLSPEIIDRQLGITNKPSAVARDYLEYGAAPASRGDSTLAKLEAKAALDLATANNTVAESHTKAAKASIAHEQQVRGMPKHMWEAHSAARGLAGGLNALWLTYGATVPLMAGAALSGGFVAAAKAGSEFAYQLTFVKALGGETAASIDMLSNATLRMSKEGLFGPTEIASGFRILAQAGLDAGKALSAMPNVLNLATVGEMNMEQAATTLVGVMNAFNLSIGESKHVGDVFAKAAALSQTSVQSMTEAMKTASVVGEQYGASLEDTAAAITLLAKVNITGTAAGTSFRNMLKELYTPVPQAAAAMKKLGLETKDAGGNLKPFADIVFDLQGKLKDFDKAGQTQILQRIFGERGAKEAIAMLSKTREEWDALVSAVKNSEGFMSKVSSELENSVKGKWAAAVNTMKSQLVQTFKEMEPVFSDLADSIKDLFSSQEFANGLKVLVSGMAELVGVLVKGAPALVLMGEAWLALKATMLGAAGLTALAGFHTALTIISAEAALAGGGLAGLRAGIVAAGSSAGVAAGASGVGMLASGLALLSNPITLTVAALATAGGAMYLFRDRTAEAMEDSTAKIVAFAKEATAQLEDVARTLGTTMSSVSLAKLKGADATLVASNDKLSTQRDTLSKKFGLNNIDEIRSAASAATTTNSTGEIYTSETQKSRAAEAYLKAIAERDKLADQYFKLKEDAERKADYEANSSIASANKPKGKPRDVNEVLGKEGGGKAASEAAQIFRNKLEATINETKKLEAQAISDLKAAEDSYSISSQESTIKRFNERKASLESQRDAFQKAAEKTPDESDKTKYLSSVKSLNMDLEHLDKEREQAFLAVSTSMYMKKADIADFYTRKIGDEEAKAASDYAQKWTTTLTQLAQVAALEDPSKFWSMASVAMPPEEMALLASQIESAKADLASLQKAFAKADGVGKFKDVMRDAKLIVSDAMSEISDAEAAMERDGGWLSRILETEKLSAVIEKAKAELAPKMAELRAAMELDMGDEQAKKDYFKFKVQYDKLGNYVPQVWKDITKSIDNTMHEAFSKIFSKGKTDWKAFGKSITEQLKTQLLDTLYQVFARKWAFSVVANVAQGAGWSSLASEAANVANGGQGSSGGGGSLVSDAQSVYSLGSKAYGLYERGLDGTVGDTISGVGNFVGDSSISAYGAGYASGLDGVSGSIAAYNTAASEALALGNTAAAAEYSGVASNLAAGAQGAAPSGLGASLGTVAGVAGAGLTAYGVGGAVAGKYGTAAGTAAGTLAGVGTYAVGASVAGSVAAGTGVAGGLGGAALYASLAAVPVWGWIAAAVVALAGALSGGGGKKVPTGISSLRGGFVDTGDGEYEGFIGQSGAEYKKKGKTSVEWGDVDAQLNDDLTNMYKSVKGGLIATGKVFEDYSLEEKAKGFVLLVDVANSNNMQGVFDALTEQVTQGLGNLMFPSIAGLVKTVTENGMAVAERWSQVFARVLAEVAAVGNVFEKMGYDFKAMFGTGDADKVLRLSDNFVQLFGNIDSMNQRIGAYYENFYTDQEKIDFGWKKMQQAFDGINQEMPTTREGFRKLVDAQIKLGPAGFEAYKALIDLQGAFAALTPKMAALTDAQKKAKLTEDLGNALTNAQAVTDAAMAALQRAVEAQKKKLTTEFESSKTALQTSIDAAHTSINDLESLFDTISAAVGTLIESTDAQLLMQRNDAQVALTAAVTAAGSGQSLIPFAKSITESIETLKKPSEQLYGSFEDYARAQGQANAALAYLKNSSADQKSVQELMLKAMEDSLTLAQKTYDDEIAKLDKTVADFQLQIDALRGIDNSVKSVEAAIKDLVAALKKETTAKAAVNVDKGLVGGTTPSGDYLKDVVEYGQKYGSDAYYFGSTNDFAAKLDAWSNLAKLTGQTIDQASGGQLNYFREIQAKFDAGLHPTASNSGSYSDYAAPSIAESVAAASGASGSAQIENLYNTILGRASDSGGAANWEAQLAGGMSIADIAAAFQNSDEYKASHAEGLDRVPFDGYKATLHAGEAVVDASSVAAIQRYFKVSPQQGGGNQAEINALINEAAAARQEQRAQAAAFAGFMSRFTRVVEKWDGDGMPSVREEA